MPISIDVGDRYIKIIDAEHHNKCIKVNKAILKSVDEGILHNGYINDKMELTLMLIDIVNENNFKKKDCYININSTDIITKEISLPKMKDRYFEKVLYNKIKEEFDDFSNFYVDYNIVETYIEDNKEQYKIFVYAVPKKIVEDFRELILNIGLVPKVFDIRRNALIKLLDYNINDKNIEGYTKVFIDLRENYMMLTLVSEQNIPLYKRDIDISQENRIEKALLNNDKNQIDTLKEKYQDSHKYNKNSDEITFLDEEDYFLEQAEVVSPIYLKIEQEIQKIKHFAMSLKQKRVIEKIYIYGIRKDLGDISKYITENTNIECEYISSMSNLKTEMELDLPKFFIAIGNIMRK